MVFNTISKSFFDMERTAITALYMYLGKIINLLGLTKADFEIGFINSEDFLISMNEHQPDIYKVYRVISLFNVITKSFLYNCQKL